MLTGAQAFFLILATLRDLLRVGPAAIEAMRNASGEPVLERIPKGEAGHVPDVQLQTEPHEQHPLRFDRVPGRVQLFDSAEIKRMRESGAADMADRAQAARKPLQIDPILLVGGPGIGKSYFATEVSAALGLPSHRLQMDNAQSGGQLAGSAAMWSNTKTGIVFDALAFGDHVSPVIVLDEIEKAPRNQHQDPVAALHGLLEPITAKTFQDASFPLTLDARFIVWVPDVSRAAHRARTRPTRAVCFVDRGRRARCMERGRARSACSKAVRLPRHPVRDPCGLM